MTTTNKKTVEENTLDLLCRDADPWTWGGTDAGCYFAFDRDGTGTISCGENQRDWLALEFTWHFSAEPKRLASKTWKSSMQMVITYSTRIARQYLHGNPWLEGAALSQHLKTPPAPSEAPFSWAPLHAPAFLPKTLTVVISRGRYVEPWQQFVKKPHPLFSGDVDRRPRRYRSKITFDVSPYPPREEWDERGFASGLERGLELQRHWEKREFVRDGIERGETWAEMLDLSWWLSPTVGEAYSRGMR